MYRLVVIRHARGFRRFDRSNRRVRKRVALDRNLEAVEFARSLGINVAINLIADPDWNHKRFRVVRE